MCKEKPHYLLLKSVVGLSFRIFLYAVYWSSEEEIRTPDTAGMNRVL